MPPTKEQIHSNCKNPQIWKVAMEKVLKDIFLDIETVNNKGTSRQKKSDVDKEVKMQPLPEVVSNG